MEIALMVELLFLTKLVRCVSANALIISKETNAESKNHVHQTCVKTMEFQSEEQVIALAIVHKGTLDLYVIS